MKIKIFALALLSYVSMDAQQKEKPSEDLIIAGKNTVKTNVTGYIFRNVNLTYERSINKRYAVSVGYGAVSKGDIPVVKSWLSDDFKKDVSDIKLSSSHFTIEPRVYFGKKYNSGFYLAPYYRYTKLKIDQLVYTHEYDHDYGAQYPNEVKVKMNGELNSNSFGLLAGAQWLFGKKQNWVLDWWIGGGHYGSTKGDLAGVTDQTLTPEMQAELQKSINNLDIPIFKVDADVTSNGVTAKLDGPWAGLRSGLSFGYRF